MLAKIINDEVVQYPYDYGHLQAENPHTRFATGDVAAAFVGTEAWNAGYRLQPVIEASLPPYDVATQVAERNLLPTLQDGAWLLGWTVREKTPDEVAAYKAARKSEVMMLRDQRVDNGLNFGGWLFQTRPQDRENIAGASQLAALWLMQGGDTNSLRWANPNADFVWIDADNELRPMSAGMMILLGKALAEFKSACIFHAKALKESIDAAATPAELAAIDITAGWP